MREFLNEVQIMRRLDFPLIVDVHEAIESRTKLNMVMDLFLGNDIATILKTRAAFHEAEAAVIVRSALLSINYLHKRGIVHRCVNPANLVFRKAPPVWRDQER